MSRLKHAAIFAAFALGAALVAIPTPTVAADLGLGGQCCADLEEKVAELEATTARKSNRKVTLEIGGTLDEAWQYTSLGNFHDNAIFSNGNEPSTLHVVGSAQFAPGWKAGYLMEINLSELGLLNTGITNESLQVRRSFWFIKGDNVGEIRLGKQDQATNDFDKWDTTNSYLANKDLSFGSISDLYLSHVDVPFDGDYRNSLKYISPEWQGFSLSATWGPSKDTSADGEGNTFDVAVRYDSKDALKDFVVKAALGYRRSTDFEINVLNLVNLQLPTGDVDTILAKGSVLNISSGVFVNGEFANQDWKDANFTLRGYAVTAGLHETKVTPWGATEVFGSWGRVEFDPAGKSTDVDYYGLGATQDIVAAGMTFYAGYRHYNTKDLIGSDADVVNAGAIVRF